MRFTDAQLLGWLQGYFWVFTRLGAALMVAPVFGGGQTPMRVRLVLVLALTLMLAPQAPPAPELAMWSSGWFLTLSQQMMIGVAIGLLLRLCFEAVLMAGTLISNGMGLGFAQLADPVNGGSTPVLGQFMTVLATLFFLALNGHLMLIQLLADSLRTLPPGTTGLGAASAQQISLAALSLFSGAVQIALPATIALLLANMAFGVMSRAAPTLNLTAVGLPVSLVIGLLLLQSTLPTLQDVFSRLLEKTWIDIGALIHV